MALEGNPGGRRRLGRPKKMWLDHVGDDGLKEKRWRAEENGEKYMRRPGFVKTVQPRSQSVSR